MIAATSLPDRTHYAPLGRCRMSTFTRRLLRPGTRLDEAHPGRLWFSSARLQPAERGHMIARI